MESGSIPHWEIRCPGKRSSVADDSRVCGTAAKVHIPEHRQLSLAQMYPRLKKGVQRVSLRTDPDFSRSGQVVSTLGRRWWSGPVFPFGVWWSLTDPRRTVGPAQGTSKADKRRSLEDFLGSPRRPVGIQRLLLGFLVPFGTSIRPAPDQVLRVLEPESMTHVAREPHDIRCARRRGTSGSSLIFLHTTPVSSGYTASAQSVYASFPLSNIHQPPPPLSAIRCRSSRKRPLLRASVSEYLAATRPFTCLSTAVMGPFAAAHTAERPSNSVAPRTTPRSRRLRKDVTVRRNLVPLVTRGLIRFRERSTWGSQDTLLVILGHNGRTPRAAQRCHRFRAHCRPRSIRGTQTP